MLRCVVNTCKLQRPSLELSMTLRGVQCLASMIVLRSPRKIRELTSLHIKISTTFLKQPSDARGDHMVKRTEIPVSGNSPSLRSPAATLCDLLDSVPIKATPERAQLRFFPRRNSEIPHVGSPLGHGRF